MLVYGFLMWRYLIKIPVRLPRLRSMSHAGPLWWHHIVVEGLSSWPTCWPLPARHNPVITPSHTAHTLANTYLPLSTGNFFQERFGLFHSCSLNTLTLLLLPPLCFPRRSTSRPASGLCVSREFLKPPVIFSYETQAVFFPIFLPCTSSLLAV